MLIITEKPSVAKDFAKALNCSFSNSEKVYKSQDEKITIVHCVGHLFNLQPPEFYNERFKHWKELPIIPEQFSYSQNPKTKDVAKIVIHQIKLHKNDEILVATDADREGEIIARECLNAAKITDYSKIKRFWVSEALTKEVILDGIKKAKSAIAFDKIAEQGFARQKADWLVGMNFTRYMTNASNLLLTTGRVQTAILSAIFARCKKIDLFTSEKYYEHFGTFKSNGNQFSGIFLDENDNRSFSNTNLVSTLENQIGRYAKVVKNQTEIKKINPPQLYNLNDLQKDAFRNFNYSAEKTLQIVQKLYEEYKCVSYPRTPSKVMGEFNIELCNLTSSMLNLKYPCYTAIFLAGDYSSNNKRVYDNSKLESHHALIPLAVLPETANTIEKNIYDLILSRFFLAFCPVHIYEKQIILLDINGYRFEISGKKVIEEGWKKFIKKDDETKESSNVGNQDLSNIDWDSLVLSSIETVEKYTKAPKYFNEASILAFMENPKAEEDNGKLIGLGTAATRHTFIPKLLKSKYIELNKQDIVITELGKSFIEGIISSPIKNLANISETTKWEEQLEDNPEVFLEHIKDFITKSVSVPLNLKEKFCQYQLRQKQKGRA